MDSDFVPGARTLNERRVETTLYSLDEAAPKPPERRSSERYLSLLRVGSLLVDGRRELCLIRNISAGGMMVRAYSDIAPGTRLSVELKHGEAVEGVARWVENGLTGVTFDEAIDVIGLLSSTMGGPRPRMPRIEVDCSAWVREGATVQRVRALNISQGGICIEAPRPLSLDADVVVTLIGLVPAAGVVRWRDESFYGIGFNRILSLPQLVQWLGAQQEKARASA